jgi:uncharacterized protein YecE (DUF72 family)
MPRRIFVGSAGWAIPRAVADRFTASGTHLQRYASVLSCAEINSSFHRPHAAATYARWADSTPAAFRFAVKVPRTITHEGKLRRARPALERFLEETSALGHRRGPLLVQLPPSLAFDRRLVARFLDLLRSQYAGTVVCEPRHGTWFSPAADALLVQYRVTRVAADPKGTLYFRMHGTPRKYWSPYTKQSIEALAGKLWDAPESSDAWCVFDNTASGAALENAWDLHHLLTRAATERPRSPADDAG